MASSSSSVLVLLVSVVLMASPQSSIGSLYIPPPTLLKYHNGPVLGGVIPVSIIWYGKFSPTQKSIVSDFILSLTPSHSNEHLTTTKAPPTVSQWWRTVDELIQKAGKQRTNIVLANQFSFDDYSFGKLLKRNQVVQLAMAAKHRRPAGIVVVLTSEDVAVEGFCISHCGLHSSTGTHIAGVPFVWVGNSATQCPGQCAWPFHQPMYGPQTTPLGSPNADVGIDGMVINIAKLMAGAVTNPSGTGFFQGEAGAAVEVAEVCSGVYGRGAFPGYAGELLVDPVTGGSYNVVGVNGRKFLVPAMFDPAISACSPMV